MEDTEFREEETEELTTENAEITETREVRKKEK